MRRRPPLPLIVVLLLAVGGGLWWWLTQRADGGEASLATAGTVEATEARLAFETGGRLATVVPREGDVVAVGAELATLDAAELSSRRDQAVAQVAAAAARLGELERGARPEELLQAEAERTAAAERLADAERDLARTDTLLAGGAVPR